MTKNNNEGNGRYVFGNDDYYSDLVRETASHYRTSRRYTVDDIEKMPDDVFAELIDGELFFMAAPKTIHQRISGKLFHDIYAYIRSNEGSCEVFHTTFGVYLFDDKKTYLHPDLSVICDPDKIDEEGCKGAPDWVVEVLSKSTRKRDQGIKLQKYREAGVREYWIVDPEKEIVQVFIFDQDEEKVGGAIYSFTDDIPCYIFPALMIRIA